MIKIQENKLILNGKEKNLNDVIIINGKENSIYFSNNLVERLKEYPYTIEEVYNAILSAGLTGFWFVNNTIININNIEKVNITYYQKVGLSIVESSKANAETCFVNIVCKNGKTERISFSSDKEAEHFYHELDDKISDLKAAEVYKQ